MSSQIRASTLADEITGRVAAMAKAARARGEQVLPPLLLLGTIERVGSNWVRDTLRAVLGQHNEPFRQQLGHGHPLSALNPRSMGMDAFVPGRGEPALAGVLRGRQVRAGAAGGEGNQLVLRLADPARAAARSTGRGAVPQPAGCGLLIQAGDLFRRWDYRARYQQMITMTRHGTGDMRRLAPLVPDDDPPDLVALVRLQVLNTALIAAALDGRDLLHISYETSVTKPARALAALAAMLPDLGGQAPELSRQPGASPPADSTFATTNRT